MAELDYYKILGVSSDATTSQIKARYQELAKKFHPDHSGDDNLMSLINEAYSTLSDSEKRATYDNRSKSTGKTSSNTGGNTYQRTHNAQSQSNQRTYSSRQSYTHQKQRTQQTYTPPPRPKPKPQQPTPTPEQVKQQKELQARIKQLQWWIKYPYILPGVFGLFVILAMSSSPYVNHTTWAVWTIISVVVGSYLYQQLLKASLRKVEQRAKQVANGDTKTKNNSTAGVVVTVLVLAGLALATHDNSSANNNANVTPAQAAINSMNQYYNPANHTAFTATDEQGVANSCMGESAIASYPYANRVRYCGCALGEVEQNFTPAQVSEATANGTYSDLQTESANAVNQYCENLL